jgi:hypothetical protein
MPQDWATKPSGITPFNTKVGDLLTGAYHGARTPDGSKINQALLSGLTGMSPVTLQKSCRAMRPLR